MLFDDHLLKSDSLVICRPSGTLNNELCTAILEGIEEREAGSEGWFDRFIDMTALDGIALSLNDMKKVAQRRREFNPNQGPVKTAFLADHALAFATAKLYEMLLGSERIEVRVFPNLEEAARWLEIDAAELARVPA